jgi:hypothetical protein
MAMVQGPPCSSFPFFFLFHILSCLYRLFTPTYPWRGNGTGTLIAQGGIKKSYQIKKIEANVLSLGIIVQ